MHPRLAVLAARQGGAFTTAQAREVGYRPDEIQRLVRARTWARLRRGVYADAELVRSLDAPGRHRLGLSGLLLALRMPAVASHTTAAVLLGLPLLRDALGDLHVTRPDLLSSRVEAGVHHHVGRLPADQVVHVGDVLVTSAARSAVDVARETDLREAVVVTDAALRAGATRAELRSALELSRDWNGSRTAGRAVEMANGAAESPGESLARLALSAGGLPEPLLQQVICDDAGVVGRVDFLWRDRRTIGEFDGRVKYGVQPGADASSAADVLWREKKREDRLREAGYEVVRMVWADLHDARALAARVRRAFSRAQQRVPLPR